MITPVAQVMTRKLITIPMGTSLHEAFELMAEKRIRHLPVVDSLNEVVGIVSQKDLNSSLGFQDIPVEMVMSSPVEFVEQELSMRQAILLMLQKKIACLLVTDPQNNTVGIITTDDLLWHLAHLLSSEGEDKPLLTAVDRQTIGELANELSMMGI